jgi:hypothetical protein
MWALNTVRPLFTPLGQMPHRNRPTAATLVALTVLISSTGGVAVAKHLIERDAARAAAARAEHGAKSFTEHRSAVSYAYLRERAR